MNHLSGIRIVKKVCPVGVGLHVAEDEEFAKQQLQYDQGDVVACLLVLNFGTLQKYLIVESTKVFL
jgi:hypothetical protein